MRNRDFSGLPPLEPRYADVPVLRGALTQHEIALINAAALASNSIKFWDKVQVNTRGERLRFGRVEDGKGYRYQRDADQAIESMRFTRTNAYRLFDSSMNALNKSLEVSVHNDAVREKGLEAVVGISRPRQAANSAELKRGAVGDIVARFIPRVRSMNVHRKGWNA